jgi:hypothetical protein
MLLMSDFCDLIGDRVSVMLGKEEGTVSEIPPSGSRACRHTPAERAGGNVP